MSEGIASKFLSSQGYNIIERNWRCRHGELDVIARLGDTLVIVEVKSRLANSAFQVRDSVSPSKLRQIYFMARLYIYNLSKPSWHRHVRFDVILIPYTVSKGDVMHCTIEHLINVLPYGIEVITPKKTYIRW